MKTLTEYIFERLIFEKQTVVELAEEKAGEIIKIVTSDNNDKFKASDDERDMLKNISDIKGKQNDIDKFYYNDESNKSNIFKIPISVLHKTKKRYKKQNYDLFIIINCYPKKDINSKLNSSDFYKLKNNKNVFYIVMNCIEKVDNIANQKDTLAHEISHFYDRIKGLGGTKNDTYNDTTINKYNKFLYYISQTEQRSFYVGFKQKLNENKKYQDLLLELFNFYKKEKECNTVDEFIEKFSMESYEYRLKNYFKDSDSEPELKPESEDKETNNQKNAEDKKTTLNEIMCHNPLRFLEYNYYILNSYDDFYKFISKNPKNEEEDDKRKKEILECLTSYNDDKPIETEEQLKNVYNGIVKIYKGTFSSYMNLIKNFIKKHME